MQAPLGNPQSKDRNHPGDNEGRKAPSMQRDEITVHGQLVPLASELFGKDGRFLVPKITDGGQYLRQVPLGGPEAETIIQSLLSNDETKFGKNRDREVFTRLSANKDKLNRAVVIDALVTDRYGIVSAGAIMASIANKVASKPSVSKEYIILVHTSKNNAGALDNLPYIGQKEIPIGAGSLMGFLGTVTFNDDKKEKGQIAKLLKSVTPIFKSQDISIIYNKDLVQAVITLDFKAVDTIDKVKAARSSYELYNFLMETVKTKRK